MLLTIQIFAICGFLFHRAFVLKKEISGFLMISNTIVFFVMYLLLEMRAMTFGEIIDETAFSVSYLAKPGMLYTAVTAMFIHSGFQHIFFNMLYLMLLGLPLENRIGGRAFLSIYFVSGLLAPLLQVIIWDTVSGVGASGAIFGIMGAYLALYPKDQIIFPFVIITRWPVYVVALGIFAMESMQVFGNSYDNVGHLVHVGGFMFGYIVARPLLDYLNVPYGEKKAGGRNTVVIDGDLSGLRSVPPGSTVVIKSLNDFGDPELQKLVERIKNETIPDVRAAWLEAYLKELKKKGLI